MARFIKFSRTSRGFAWGSFQDSYGVECRLSKSSAASADYVWLGVCDPNPQILATQARAHGVETSETCGWVPYPIPKAVSIRTEMHLNRRQAKALGEALLKFAATGELNTKEPAS